MRRAPQAKPACRLLLVLLALWLGIATPAVAQWPNRQINYIAVDQDIRQVLRDFAATLDISVVLSDNVQGTISGNFTATSPENFMREMAKLNGLIWFLFNNTLYVYDASEAESRILTLSNTPAALFRDSLRDLGIYRDRFAWRANPDLNVVLVSGPPYYVSLIEQIAGVVEGQRAAQPRVEVYRLQHASAIDRTITYRDQALTVPGVTTTLRELFGLDADRGVQRQTLPVALTGLNSLTGQGLASRGGAEAGANAQAAPATGATAPAAAGAIATQGQAQNAPTLTSQQVQQSAALAFAAPQDITIESDPRLNAVLVKARADQLPFIASLIQRLDVSTRLIQIDVTIMDLSISRLVELGVEWNLGGDFTVGTQSTIAEGIQAGLQIAGAISDPFDIVADIRALEEAGEARVVSQPSVITFDNVEAVIDESETIHVRVQGNEDVDLFKVQTGTLLRVTPRIVEVTGRREREVELFVDIRDGTFDASLAVDEIPAVLESTLTTSAIVEAEQGLLLGGLYRTELRDTEEKVPLLGDIPVLGLAFRSTSSRQSDFARLFLITPSPVNLSPAVADSAFGLGGLEPVASPPAAVSLDAGAREATRLALDTTVTSRCRPSDGTVRRRYPQLLTLNQISDQLACLSSETAAPRALE